MSDNRLDLGPPIRIDPLKIPRNGKPKTDEIHSMLKEKLSKAVQKSFGSRKRDSVGLLLAGIDSIILAYIYSAIYPNSTLKTIVVGRENSSDINYARKVVSYLGITEHYEHIIGRKDIENVIPKVGRIRVFNPTNFPEDLVIYFGLEFAEKHAIKSVMTGEGADELFAGNSRTHFTSNDLGKYFHIDVIQPYLEPEFMEFVRKNNIKKSDLRETAANCLSDYISDLFEIIYAKKFPPGQTSGLSDIITQEDLYIYYAKRCFHTDRDVQQKCR